MNSRLRYPARHQSKQRWMKPSNSKSNSNSKNYNGGLLLSIFYGGFLILACLSPSSVEATISFMNSGRTFRSRMDPHVGQPLLRGYEYMGRLQYVVDNPTLCPGKYPDQKFDIVTPIDGLPVALVAQAGGCSVIEKARVAANMINPANNVQYLIIQDPNKRRKSSTAPNDDRVDKISNINIDAKVNNHDGNEKSQIALDGRYIASEFEGLFQSLTGNRDYAVDDFDEPFYLDLSDIEQHGRVLTRLMDTVEQSNSNSNSNSNSKNGKDLLDLGWDSSGIGLAVMHVTLGVGEELFRAIVEENPIDHRQGGTRILLNGKESNVSVRTIVMWMLLSFSICACTCCCVLLVFAQNDFDDEEDPQQAPRRPVRRRLTLEQVRARFPSFHFNPQEHHQKNNNGNCSDCACGNDGDDNGGEEAVALAVEQQKGYMQLSDECTICLDEFTPGIRVRQLPCGHVFHSTCIARWFIERSAVCPLCKLDLYEEPIEDDNEEDDDDNNNEGNDRGETGGETSPGQTLLSFFGSWWSGRSTTITNSEGYTQLEIPPGDVLATTDTAAEGAVGEGTTATASGEEAEEETRSWWPFSLETTSSTDEEEDQHHSDNHRRRPRSSPLPSAAGVFSWTMANVFGRRGSRSSRRRHGHEQQPNQESTNDDNGNGNMLTELTEPLVPRGSLLLEEARFIDGRVDNITNNDVEGTTIHHQTHAALLPDSNNNSNANGSPFSTSAEV